MSWKNLLNFTLTAMLSVCLVFAESAAWATAEEDPNPGPPVKAEVDPTVTKDDVSTKGNTLRFAPVAPRSVREPVATSVDRNQGVLSGRIVFTSPGHGWQWSSTLGRWATDRGNNNEIVEDFGNHDQFTYYCNYLFNAGATVVPFRPVGNQTNEVILDNDDSQVTYAGTWSNSGSSAYYGQASDSVSYRFAITAASETAVATYRPNIPQRGFYPIYTWVLNSSNRSPDQLYRINHSGGVSEVRIDHIKVGRGWVYLGTYYLESGTDAYVEISNQSATAGNNVIADAIRFGNGMGDVVDGGVISGYPREDEGNVYWVQRMNGQGGDSSVYSGNVGSPPRASAYMNNDNAGVDTDRVYIGIHSNASAQPNQGRGARGLYNESSFGTTPNQLSLATILGKELNQDMQAIPSAALPTPWWTGNTHTYHASFNYGELNGNSIDYEMDATIIETAFHDSSLDAQLMRDPNGRKYIARAILHGTIKYFNQHGGGQAIFPPNPPIAPEVVSNGDGTVTVAWAAPPSDPTGSGAPTSYVVYRSTNGYGFGNPETVTGSTQLTISDATADSVTYFRVASRNAAGESFPTETVAVRPAASGANNILVVNAFDRLDIAMNVRETRIAVGEHDRVKPWKSNNYDYVVPHAKALHSGNYYFDSVSNEVLDATLLANYQFLIWAAGEESTDDETFSAAEQALVQNFLNAGKGIMVSGAEIGWDLDAQTGGQAFYNNFLLTDYATDDANTYNISAGVGILSGVPAFNFGPTSTIHDTSYPPINRAFYDADYADTINATGGSSKVLSYTTGGGAAVAGSSSGYSVVSFGFPFENITNSSARNQLMSAAMVFLGADSSSVPDWAIY